MLRACVRGFSTSEKLISSCLKTKTNFSLCTNKILVPRPSGRSLYTSNVLVSKENSSNKKIHDPGMFMNIHNLPIYFLFEG